MFIDEPFLLDISPPHESSTGWRVKVFMYGQKVGEAVENSHHEAAAIGAGLAERAYNAYKREVDRC